MAKQTVNWTVLPNGRIDSGNFAGQYRVTIVVAPRLTPQTSNERTLQAFPSFHNWPETVSSLNFELQVGNETTKLLALNKGDKALWKLLLGSETPVTGFQYQDMSKVNLRSYAVRNVLGFLRKHYGSLAVQAAAIHPTLLPLNETHPGLRAMLADLGTGTRIINFGHQSKEVAIPGFSRFYDDDNPESPDALIRQLIFTEKSRNQGNAADIDSEQNSTPSLGNIFPLRALPADWQVPAQAGSLSSVMNLFNSADEYTFFQANRFYRREPSSKQQQAMRRPTFNNIPPAPQTPEYDFHRIIASYADFPQVLRGLGLIIDCVVEDSKLFDSQMNAENVAVGQMSLRLSSNGNHDISQNGFPRTAWLADKERFVLRPRTNDHEWGMLRLQNTDDTWGVVDKEVRNPLFDVYQADPDGAALKTVGFTLTAQNLLAKSLSPVQLDGEITYTTGNKQPVASLRSGGLGISRHGRAEQTAVNAMAAALKNQAFENGDSKKTVLFAEDLLRGYRVDVAPVEDADSPGRWYSLCARDGQYISIKANQLLTINGNAPIPDEGYVKGASTTRSADDNINPDDHYLHESIFRWTGWSLCTPRPGLTLQAQQDGDSKLQSEQPTQVTEVADKGNGIAATFKALKGSLPKLRFGQLYRLRARLVDLAGNSLALEDPSLDALENATDAVGYWRFEPVDPPALIHRTRVSEGESLERMVIRSNYNVTTNDYLTSADFASAIAATASVDFDYHAVNERHLVPPKASQLQCEQHGMFDQWMNDPAAIKQGYAVAARESGSLYDPLPDAQVSLITPKSVENVKTLDSMPPQLPSPQNPTGDRLAAGQYIIHGEALITTPYLSDPAAGGVALRAAPGHELPGISIEISLGEGCEVVRAPNQELVLRIDYNEQWPDHQGLRIVLAERMALLNDLPCSENFQDAGLPLWDVGNRVLTLFVAKGRIVRLLYSSFVADTEQFIGSFGIPQWANVPSDSQFIEKMAISGCHWMVTPYRSLTLVHATQQPVCLPELIKLRTLRQQGDQHADLICPLVRLHGPSTGKFEIEAEWSEWVDDLQKDQPEWVTSHGQLGEIQLPENHQNQFNLHQTVLSQEIDPQRRRAPGDRHELGDTHFHLIQYRIRATTRFREYLPPSLYEQRDLVTRLGSVASGSDFRLADPTDPGAAVLPDDNGSNQQSLILASAAPDDPRVLYVVPTFRWYKNDNANGTVLVRQGNGLRVWLDRPWFSSGDGELLGVVIFGNNQSFSNIPTEMTALVTQWGRDPVWDAALPKEKVQVTDFTSRVVAETVRLQERPDDPEVHVVGHRVHWDADRKLWYCDIELELGATYMPFVRLALVRYQPNALSDTKLSKVVQTEFAQVLPRRRAELKMNDQVIKLSLHGHVPEYGSMKYSTDSAFLELSFLNGPFETGRNRIELVLQTRDRDIDSDLAWHDVSTLASTNSTQPSSSTNPLSPIIQPQRGGNLPAGGRTVRSRSGAIRKLSAEVNLGVITNSDKAKLVVAIPGLLPEPEIWQTEVTLPDTGEKPARLVLREFERYYTDRTVPQNINGTIYRRRVIEERLVYTAMFNLVE